MSKRTFLDKITSIEFDGDIMTIEYKLVDETITASYEVPMIREWKDSMKRVTELKMQCVKEMQETDDTTRQILAKSILDTLNIITDGEK